MNYGKENLEKRKKKISSKKNMKKKQSRGSGFLNDAP